MNRFLRKEWNDTKIPHRVRVQARQKAWMAIRKGQAKRGLFRATWAAVPATVLGLLIFGWLAFPLEAPIDDAAFDDVFPVLPLTERWREPSIDLEANLAPLPVRARIEPSATELRMEQAPPQRKHRLVMNFILPKTGVRMIWIQERPSEKEKESL